MFRSWITLNGVEIANSSRLVAHLGTEPPTSVFQMPFHPGSSLRRSSAVWLCSSR